MPAPDNSATFTGAGGIQGGDGDDTITGGNTGSVIDAGNGNDSISMGTGADTISGGAGNDIISGGGGHDLLTGGGGADTFVFAAGSSPVAGGQNGVAVITDWNSTDHLDISVAGAFHTDATGTSFSDAQTKANARWWPTGPSMWRPCRSAAT